MSVQLKGTLMTLLSAAGFATLPLFIKLAYAAGANTVTILAIRFVLAACILWPMLKLRNISCKIGSKQIIRLSLLGILGYGITSLCFASAISYLPVSLAALLLYMYPALVTILSFVIGDERPTWYKIGALAICFAGLCLILGVSAATVHPLGIVFGLSAAVIYSGYIIAGKRILKDVNELTATTYVCTSIGLMFTLVGLLQGSLVVALPSTAWLALLGSAIPGTIIGVLFLFAGLNRIGAANASIVSTAEPLITVLLSIVLLHDNITSLQVGGGLLIIASIVMLQLKVSRPQLEAASQQ